MALGQGQGKGEMDTETRIFTTPFWLGFSLRSGREGGQGTGFSWEFFLMFNITTYRQRAATAGGLFYYY
jgi:hypothetical protein